LVRLVLGKGRAFIGHTKVGPAEENSPTNGKVDGDIGGEALTATDAGEAALAGTHNNAGESDGGKPEDRQRSKFVFFVWAGVIAHVLFSYDL